MTTLSFTVLLAVTHTAAIVATGIAHVVFPIVGKVFRATVLGAAELVVQLLKPKS